MASKLKAMFGSMRFWMVLVGAVVAYAGNTGVIPGEVATTILGFIGVSVTIRTVDKFV